MTPRQADVAFVLEDVPGVRAVYAVRPSVAIARNFEFAIEVDASEKVRAHAHYMLLRALTHEECQRVHWFHAERPPSFTGALTELHLNEFERAAARTRVRPIDPLAVVYTPPPQTLFKPIHRILIVGCDDPVVQCIRDAYEPQGVECITTSIDPARLLPVTSTDGFDVVIGDARAVTSSLLAATRERLVILARRYIDPIVQFRMKSARIVLTPFKTFDLHAAVLDVLCYSAPLPSVLVPLKAAPAPPPRRTLSVAARSESLRILLVDIDAGIRAAIASAFGSDAAQIDIASGRDAVDRALSLPFHGIFCSTSTALARDGFIASVRREDPTGVARVVIVVPAVDASFVAASLRDHRILRLPVDEVLLRGFVGRVAPKTIERAAVAEAPLEPSAVPEPVRFRRLAVLVVDEHVDTQILFAAGSVSDKADIAHVSTSVAAFEHLTGRPVDLLVISASLRSDGGEPFYRVIWRMMPALKARTILVTTLDRESPRVLRRPLSRAALDDVVSRASR